jgi:hypothetical protein
MQIQINTDRNIDGNEQLAAETRATVSGALDRFSSRISRVEVHLSDENSAKGGNDKRCVIEVRVEGLRPVAVTHQATTVQQAVVSAADKMKAVLDSTLSRLRGH